MVSIYRQLVEQEPDACNILAIVQRDGLPDHKIIDQACQTLLHMQHRAGFVNGEGDGCGLLMHIPRKLWSRWLELDGIDGELSQHEHFTVAHLFLPKDANDQRARIDEVSELFEHAGFRILTERRGKVHSSALGERAMRDEPLFWQVAALYERQDVPVDRACHRLQLEIEKITDVHVLSLSTDTVVYKVLGTAQTLRDYFVDLSDPDCETTAVVGHNRYSTSTTIRFDQLQPFSLLGHNGEINTIKKLREETKQLHIPLSEGSSDSQDMDRLLDGLTRLYGWSLLEAMELLFPPIINEIRNYEPKLRDLYYFYRHAWGPFAQGPAGVLALQGKTFVASSDALGLRPVWLLTTETSYVFASESGCIPISELVEDPKPLAPGEKVAVRIVDDGSELLSYPAIQQKVYEATRQRFPYLGDPVRTLKSHDDPGEGSNPEVAATTEATLSATRQMLSAWAWEIDDVNQVNHYAQTGHEPIGSLGYDGPLAALANHRQNLADYFKETVAAVTNPAIDREREIEHFSTRTILGRRPALENEQSLAQQYECQLPILLGGHPKSSPLPASQYRAIAHEWETYLVDDIVADNPGRVAHLQLSYPKGTNIPERLQQLSNEAVEAVRKGAEFIILHDHFDWVGSERYLDVQLGISAVDLALKRADVATGEQNLRRRASIIVSAGSIRNLHDIVVSLGFGADAVNPYAMIEIAVESAGERGLSNFCAALQKGLEKVISTLGIHEFRGYARLFSAIGLEPEVVAWLDVENVAGKDQAGLGWDDLERDAEERFTLLVEDPKARPGRAFRMYPRIWRKAGELARGECSYDEYGAEVKQQEIENPVSLRHVLDFKFAEEQLDPSEVRIDIGIHDLPFLISSMSFGSQSEVAYRSYPEAAKRLNMLAMNGEGGEIKDMLGRYPDHRGIQIASGRFGINAEMVNAANLLEIKIGQGAKPGEGGHLPARKVSAKVAAARNAKIGVDLISPSNNHDIYSIEDLIQIIDELKTVNTKARVAVKVPVVPDVGMIAVGAARAGADIITLSGFDGGTGAARTHALRHVGLPVEIGVVEAHRALVKAGLRDQVELWADGGVKTAEDVVKLVCMGANRVGFATLAMVAVGCTICRGCQTDTCHVGIATQMETVEEAASKGVKRFVPREFEQAVSGLVHLFQALGEGVRSIVARLGAPHLQALVGRTDLLVQSRLRDRVDLSDMLMPVAYHKPAPYEAIPPRIEPRTQTSLSLAEQVGAQLHDGHTEIALALEEEQIRHANRAIGTAISGTLARTRYEGAYTNGTVGNMDDGNGACATLRLANGAVPGHGLASLNADGLDILVEGGAQDGVGKTGFGGRIAIMKGLNKHGVRVHGSVGKSMGYGAQRGLFLVQGNADSRAGIRLSGADVVIGGEPTEPLHDDAGNLAARANIKGFAFEYMTNGRAVVLGDPGPWLCSGMTGGVVYVRLLPEWGLDENAIRRRLAKGAKVYVEPLSERGEADVQELLAEYVLALRETDQELEAQRIEKLAKEARKNFLQILPMKEQTDPSISTE